jgi:hypothetical protein
MFNLPIPTDSLYKFAFMFGLVLIIFSVYFRDKQLNRYDKTQNYQMLDSISYKKLEFDELYHSDSVHLEKLSSQFLKRKLPADSVTKMRLSQEFTDSIRNWGLSPLYMQSKPVRKDYRIIGVYSHIVNGGNILPFERLEYEFKQVKIRVLSEDNYINKDFNRKIKFYTDKMNQDSKSFTLLFIIGLVLFILGTIGWYFKIQKPQDELLAAQVVEAKKKISLIGEKIKT